MNFTTITADEFRAFAATSPYKSFMQTPEIAKLREKNGWTAYYFAATEDDEIKAATVAVAKPTFLGKSTFILPGGPLLDLEDTAVTQFFIKHLAKYIKSHNGYTLHISPYYELRELDRYGIPLANGFNHQKAIKNLVSLGFTKLAHPDQPEYLFAMDINGRTPDQLLADFKRNTRNHIKKAEKMGVKVRELKREELDKLKAITASTAKRRDFTDKPLSYYEQMYDLFAPRHEVKFIIAEANDIPLSAAMFMLYGDEIVYLFSGSDEKYMKEYNAQYLIQWHMIKYASEHGFKRYNFYGISGLPKNGELDGIYEFKKGFAPNENGHVIELAGSYELSINAPFCQLHRLLAKLKHH